MSDTESASGSTKKTRSAGAFDVRNVIGGLIGIYGLVLVLCGFFMDPGVNPETGQLKSALDNVWAGVGMLVVALAFIVWARSRPVEVPPEAEFSEPAEPTEPFKS